MSLPKLSAGQIQYIALEGGGGAGNAFPGAIQALADPRLNVNGSGKGILQYADYKVTNIKGFAGASAGAITACLLSCGYDADEAAAISQQQNFNDFFDTPQAGLVFRVGGFRKETPKSSPVSVLQVLELILRFATGTLSPLDTGLLLAKLAAANKAQTISLVSSLALMGLASQVYALLPLAVQPGLVNKLGEAIQSIDADFGLFPGAEARSFIHKCLVVAAYRVKNRAALLADSTYTGLDKAGQIRMLFGSSKVAEWAKQNLAPEGLSFEQHQATFGCKLAVTGTNLETLKTHLFSAATTPKFLVEDAVRVSMSLPFIFKPLILKEKADLAKAAGGDADFAGVWVDGGLLNNIPMRVFDNEPGANPKTFGLRLNPEPRKTIDSLSSYLKVWPVTIGFLGTGESQVSQTLNNADDAVILDTSPVGLLDFQPDAATLYTIQDRAKKTVLAYFNL